MTSGITEIPQGFQSPEMIEALQERLGALNGLDSGYISSLTPEVKLRIKALENLHDESGLIEAQMQGIYLFYLFNR